MIRLTILVFAGLVFAAAPAAAEPSVATLDAVLQSCPTIVIARYRRPPDPNKATSYVLVVERAIRGTVPKGVFQVKPSPAGHAFLADGARVVAFVNASSEWIATATTLAGSSLESGVLRLSGFYDFNAALISPGVATLDKLEALITSGTPMTWTFRGPILVASPAGIVASKIEVTATAPQATVSGLPALVGFPAPTVDIGSWDGRDVVVTWERELHRPLVLEGAATGRSADGSIAVRFRLGYPSLVTEADLRAYLADGKKGHPYYELVLARGTKREPIVLDKEIGRIGTIGGVEIGETSLAPQRYVKLGAITIELAAPTAKATSGGTTNGLVEESMTGPIGCTYVAGATRTPCTITYVATKFTAR